MPRNLITAASLPATPETLYDMYLDPLAHAAFTGAPVEIEARAGAAFRAFEGSLAGTILHVDPKRLIVQTWRSIHFSRDEIDSILILTFLPEFDGGARIELAQINIADGDFAGVSHGWEKYYWAPWRNYLSAGSRP
jgi:activator of HSP90 ATPase